MNSNISGGLEQSLKNFVHEYDESANSTDLHFVELVFFSRSVDLY